MCFILLNCLCCNANIPFSNKYQYNKFCYYNTTIDFSRKQIGFINAVGDCQSSNALLSAILIQLERLLFNLIWLFTFIFEVT